MMNFPSADKAIANRRQAYNDIAVRGRRPIDTSFPIQRANIPVELTAPVQTNPYTSIDFEPTIEVPEMGNGNPYMDMSRDSNTSYGNKDTNTTRDTKSYEGFRSNVYTDTTGNATVGYGHKLTADEIKSGKYANGVTKAQADVLYKKDKTSHNKAFYSKESWAKRLSPSQREALEDLSFNMGSGFFDKFPSARKALMSGDHNGAANIFENSLYRKQVGQRALDNAAKLRVGY